MTAADQAKAQAEDVLAQRAKAWGLFYAGKYEEAAGVAQVLLKSDQRNVQAEAAHLLARCCWSDNKPQTRAQAQKLWQDLGKAQPTAALSLRLNIAKALVLADQGKTTQAIELLEGLIRRDSGGTATAEAAVELAGLYVKAKRIEEARKVLDFAVAFLGKDRLVKMELDEAEVAPFIKAAQEAKAHLKYDANAGLAEFEQAEKVRSAGKLQEAGTLYQAIVKAYPDSDSALRSQLCIGYCLAGMKQLPAAVEHWKRFITASPSGSWRGQAYVALIDLYLEDLLDVNEAAKQSELARNSVSAALSDEKAAPSWKEAAFDLYVRVGMVQLAQGRPEAGDSFEQALKAKALSPEVQSSIASLIAAAKAGKPPLPDDLQNDPNAKPGSIASKATLALTMGTIHNISGRFDHAAAFFDRILKGELRSATPAQLAFAAFGKAAALQGQGKAVEAKDGYLASLKTFAAGSWHDETLYRLARIIQAQADAQNPAPALAAPKDAGNKADPKQPEDAKPLTAAELEQRAALERDRQAKLLKAKGEALPYWDELIKKYPASPRAWTAYYNAGVLLWQMQHWDEAADVFNQFVTVYPKHPLAGEAYARLIDMALEDTFSLKAAEAASASAVQWVAQNATDDAANASRDKELPAPWRATTFRDPQADVKSAAYEIYLRAGLVAYLSQKNDQATEFFRKGNDFDTSHRAQTGAETSLARMIDIAQGKQQPLTPPDLLPLLKDDKQKTGIILADLYLMTFSTDKAAELYQRLLRADRPFPKPEVGVEAYLLLRVGQSLEFQRKHDEAIAYLKRLYDPQYAKYPWTADGIFRVGTWIHNATQDPKEAMQHWQYVFTQTPSHPEAERSLFYYGISAARMQEYGGAIQAYQEYIKRYPQGRWTKRIETELLPEAQQKQAEKQQSGKEKQR